LTSNQHEVERSMKNRMWMSVASMAIVLAAASPVGADATLKTGFFVVVTTPGQPSTRTTLTQTQLITLPIGSWSCHANAPRVNDADTSKRHAYVYCWVGHEDAHPTGTPFVHINTTCDVSKPDDHEDHATLCDGRSQCAVIGIACTTRQ
jgi:hypothetical protein